MKSLERIKHDNNPKRAIGEVAAGRARRRRTVLYFAKAQLDGGVFSEFGARWVRCKRCDGDFHVTWDHVPCAFCDSCKDDVLDMLAEAVVNAAKKKARRR